MPLSLLALIACANVSQSADPVLELTGPGSAKKALMIREIADPLETPEKSPKLFGTPPHFWTFDWQTIVFETVIAGPPYFPRFNVFSQERKPDKDTAVAVARMLGRLWNYGYQDLNRDHSNAYGGGVVEVFLCNGGIPGGEQLYGEDRNNGKQLVKVNTIYFYDLPTFKDSLEMAREVAHEYGHATLCDVGGYQSPEDWANGFLGEKLYLRYLRDEMVKHELGPEDAMGATLSELDHWVNTNVDPLVASAAETGPDIPSLKKRDAKGMDRFIGLALYTDTILPESVFSRAMEVIPSTDAEDFPEAIALAAEEKGQVDLRIPSYLKGKSIWVPVNHKGVTGAEIVKRSGKWAYLRPTSDTVTINVPGSN